MSKVRLIGASNRSTNKTSEFGSMAGLAPTTNVRPNVTGLPGYKYTATAANGVNWITGVSLNSAAYAAGCGLGKSGADGEKCLRFLGITGTNQLGYFKTGGQTKLLS